MEIFFSDIPEEGIPFTGKLAPAFFNLTEGDSIRISGDIEYDLTIFSFKEVAVLTGSIRGPIELQCVTCLDFFPSEIDFPEWEAEVDIEERQTSFDPRESIRDEILLTLPSTPHCDEMIENRVCPKVDLLKKFEHVGGGGNEEADVPPPGNAIWGVLDQLGKEK